MRIRLDSSLPADDGWLTPPAVASRVLIGRPEGAELREAGRVVRRWKDPLAALEWLDSARHEGGRWAGFFAYELGFLLEPAAGNVPRDLSIPLFAWGQLEHPQTGQREPAVPGRVAGRFSARAAPGCAEDALQERPRRPPGPGVHPRSTFTRPAYLQAVQRCIDYIYAGDVYQVNLSQRLSLDFRGSAAGLYEALQAHTPAPYAALLELGDLAVISNSPELFLRRGADRRIVTRPIKGTRPRSRDEDEDANLREALLISPKETAELSMIIDLERNDLGRVCEIGSIRVSRARGIEPHPTVWHGVAEVEGRLRADVGLVELLRATFPGGSVTGAPKIRAMQIISELEPVPRGVYCGAIGYIDADGSLQLSVAIRTMSLAGGVLQIPVGGGIVAESEPEEEYEETLVKARAMLSAADTVTGDPG